MSEQNIDLDLINKWRDCHFPAKFDLASHDFMKELKVGDYIIYGTNAVNGKNSLIPFEITTVTVKTKHKVSTSDHICFWHESRRSGSQVTREIPGYERPQRILVYAYNPAEMMQICQDAPGIAQELQREEEAKIKGYHEQVIKAVVGLKIEDDRNLILELYDKLYYK